LSYGPHLSGTLRVSRTYRHLQPQSRVVRGYLAQNADDHPEDGGETGHGSDHGDRVIAELIMH